VKATAKSKPGDLPALQTGQVWLMKGSHLQIGTVGKRLVHYKYFRGDAKRSTGSLSPIAVIEKFLKTNKAVLATEPFNAARSRPRPPA
jgi:hypothetical protein